MHNRRRNNKKRSPLVYKERVPDVSEFSLSASGPSLGKLTRNDPKFKELVPNYSKDIIFRDEEGTGSDRLMTSNLKQKLDILAVLVMNTYPGIKLRVTEAWDENSMHSPNSLHYEGRAVDITTSDRDRSKYGMLGRLAIEAGFDFVYYESRSHIHCSVKRESDNLERSGGCFNGDSTVHTLMGKKKMSQLRIGDKVLVATADGSLDYSEIILFLDHDNSESRWFQTIITESGAEITLTSSHLIFSKSGDNLDDKKVVATYAKDIEIEAPDLLQAKISLEKVVNVTVVRKAGIFAPLTLHGTVVVNNVVASCYAVISNHHLAHVAFLPMRILYNFKLASLYFLQELRVLKFKTSKISTSQSRDGLHWYAELLNKIADKLTSKNFLNSWHIDFVKM
ncbi:unnamed protein product [Larinioides sclopetarius]|uniref:Protein hedgehog n=1 Tax=Larinioides sclopetarius TaxID=280406 RepID=A0AAV1YWQ4_9ARAC